MDLNEVLEHWKQIAGESSDEPWSEDDLYGYFQRFRPDGDRLDQALQPLPGGAAVHERLKAVFAATKSGWTDDDSTDGYFVVREPLPISPSDAESLVRSHLRNVTEIASLSGADELVDLLRAPTFTISREAPPDSPDRHDTDLMIYDTLCDWAGSLESDPPEADDLREAFYSIACDYPLSWYVM